jgi:hypothetical protein
MKFPIAIVVAALILGGSLVLAAKMTNDSRDYQARCDRAFSLVLQRLNEDDDEIPTETGRAWVDECLS